MSRNAASSGGPGFFATFRAWALRLFASDRSPARARLAIEMGGNLLMWRRDIDAQLDALKSGKLVTRADFGSGEIDTTADTIERLEKLKAGLHDPGAPGSDGLNHPDHVVGDVPSHH